MKSFLLLVPILIFSSTLKAEATKPQLLRTLNCTATLVKAETNKPKETKVSFTLQDYSMEVAFGGYEGTEYYTTILLNNHPRNSKQKLYGTYATNGGIGDPNTERDGDPRGRGGWQGLTWYDLYTTKKPKGKSVARLFLKSKKEQSELVTREYNLSLQYDFEDGEEGVVTDYGSENVVCTLAK